jgi:hypothetical protein
MSPEELNSILQLFSVVVGIFGIISFIFNIIQHFKIQSLHQAVDSLDRIAKSAKMECAKLQANSPNEEGKAKIRVISALAASMLNVTTTFLKYQMKHFEGTKNSTPFISID